MSVDDRGDELAELRELKRRVDRLESGSMLENSSITRGRMRFIGGLLRVDSGGRVEIVGTLAVEGTSQFIGPVTISGKLDVTGDTTVTGEFTLDGPWTINGDGDITGDVDVTGDFTVLGGGRIKVGNVVLTPGNGGRITIGTGSSQIIIDPSQLKVGPAFKMDPAHSSTGAQMAFGLTGKSTIYGDDTGVQIVNTNGQYPHNFTVDSVGYSMLGVLPLPQGQSASYLVIGGDGRIYSSAGMGGGGTPEPGQDLGNFQWPFALSTVTSEYGPRWGRIHEGIDFGLAPAVAGAPIIAAGDGTIAVNTFSAGWGNYVRITHSVGGQQLSTLYAHMNAPGMPAVGSTVQKGDVIGYVGNTGNSFGAHLHFETWMGTSYGTHTNPRDFMAAFGPE